MSGDPRREEVPMRELLLATIEPPAPGLAERVLAAVANGPDERREPRGHWALSLVAVLLAGALVGTLVLGVRLTHRSGTPAAGAAPAVAGIVAIRAAGARVFPGGWVAEQSANRRVTLFQGSDGGRTWVPRLTYDGGLPSQVVLDASGAGVIVAGPRDESAAELLVYQTADGGVTWKRMPAPTGASAWGIPFFVDGRQGWVLASLGAAVAEMLSTTDGGQTWTAGTQFNDRANFPGLSSVHLRILWASGGRAIVVPPLGAGTVPVHVFVTDDGGATWRSSFPATAGQPVTAANGQLDARLLPDGRAVLFLQPVDEKGRGTALLAFVSADAGRSWSQGVAVDGPAADRALFALDDAHWWASTGSGADLLTTADGGRTVQRHPAALPGGFAFQSIGFTSPGEGWAVATARGQTALFLSHDGGAHWEPLTPPV